MQWHGSIFWHTSFSTSWTFKCQTNLLYCIITRFKANRGHWMCSQQICSNCIMQPRTLRYFGWCNSAKCLSTALQTTVFSVTTKEMMETNLLVQSPSKLTFGSFFFDFFPPVLELHSYISAHFNLFSRTSVTPHYDTVWVQWDSWRRSFSACSDRGSSTMKIQHFKKRVQVCMTVCILEAWSLHVILICDLVSRTETVKIVLLVPFVDQLAHSIQCDIGLNDHYM